MSALDEQELEAASYSDREAADEYEAQSRRRADVVRAAMLWFWTPSGSAAEAVAKNALLHACERNSGVNK
jgi:hypothetical protein